MVEYTIRFLEKDELELILQLARELNESLSEDVLADRLKEMPGQGYQCLAVFDGDSVIGVCGIWVTTRFYCGKQVEVDNVVVSGDYRGKGIGKLIMEQVYKYAESIGCGTVELNAYVRNYNAHKFYINEGCRIIGYH